MTVTTLFARRIQRPDFKSPSDIVALFVQPPRISRIYRLLDPLGFTSSEGGVRILNGTSPGDLGSSDGMLLFAFRRSKVCSSQLIFE